MRGISLPAAQLFVIAIETVLWGSVGNLTKNNDDIFFARIGLRHNQICPPLLLFVVASEAVDPRSTPQQQESFTSPSTVRNKGRPELMYVFYDILRYSVGPMYIHK